MLFTLTCAAATHTAVGQSVAAKLSGADTVRQGERLLLSFEFEDVSPRAFELPEMVGLRIIGGPNRRSQVSISGGVRRSSTSLGYYALAVQSGLAYVPPVAVETAGGDTLHTAALQVFVTSDPDFMPLEELPTESAPRRSPPTVKM